MVNVVKPLLMDVPGLWFVTNFAWLLVLSFLLIRFMRFLRRASQGVLTLRLNVNKKISMAHFQQYLRSRQLLVLDASQSGSTYHRKCTWLETERRRWRGSPPKLEVEYDEMHGFLLKVTIVINRKRSKALEADLLKIFLDDLVRHHVMDADVAAQPIVVEKGLLEADAGKLKQD